eukprot:5083412-Amphidinium_carterae.1
MNSVRLAHTLLNTAPNSKAKGCYASCKALKAVLALVTSSSPLPRSCPKSWDPLGEALSHEVAQPQQVVAEWAAS